MDLLPPNATKLEQDVEAATARIGDVPVPLRPLWDPQTCPIELLPWLAWALSVDVWDPLWSEAAKRGQVAQAVAMQRRKGCVASVRSFLDAYGIGITLTEWFETTPPGAPHTFAIEIPLTGDDGPYALAPFADRLVSLLNITKPVRSHFTLTQAVEVSGEMGMLAAARPAVLGRRMVDTPVEDSAGDWAGVLLTEDGEPCVGEDGATPLETGP